MSILQSLDNLIPKELRDLIKGYIKGPFSLVKLEFEQRILSGIKKNYELNGEYLLCYDFSHSSGPPFVMSEKKEDFVEFLWDFSDLDNLTNPLYF